MIASKLGVAPFAFGVYLGVLTCNLLKAASRRHVEYAVKLQTDLLFAA